jgi:DNA-binding NarL/FixJ family response regulator
MKELRLLIADDHEVVRRGIRSLIESHPGWTVVAEADDGLAAVEEVKRASPDIAVLDISMPELNGLEAARRIASEAPKCQVLILSVHDTEQMVREVLQAGARGYVLKSDAGRHLVEAIEALQANTTYFTSRVATMILQGYLHGKTAPAPVPPQGPADLTPRERQIVQLLAEGLSNKETAAKLGISVKTVETHRKNIMQKLGMSAFSELVRYAIRNNLVSP